ncbi:cytoplasmic protein [Salmonella enterica subsp. enterica serovar Typhi]|nr:cytoplasmic protein [Salmonella enterica subsp. enterica serovar Typhi]
MNPYKEEIIHAHAAIENWLSKGGAPIKLSSML